VEFTPKPMTTTDGAIGNRKKKCSTENAQSGRQSSAGVVQALGRRKRWLPSLQPTCSWIPIGILLRVNASLGTSPNI
jgi:hypothetical protein